MYHDGELVKYESFVEDIISVLSDGSEDSYTLGIWGMFIIGKATLALNVFIKMFTSFDASCFIPNVKEEELRPGGLDHLRRELYFKLLEGESLNSSTPGFDLNLETQRLRHKKVLVVLNDVTSSQQIEFLIGSLDRFMPGSVIIVTTGDHNVLKNIGAEIFKMKGLANGDAPKLFSREAFRRNQPGVAYKELFNKVIESSRDVPLALKVSRSSLSGSKGERIIILRRQKQDLPRKRNSMVRKKISNFCYETTQSFLPKREVYNTQHTTCFPFVYRLM